MQCMLIHINTTSFIYFFLSQLSAIIPFAFLKNSATLNRVHISLCNYRHWKEVTGIMLYYRHWKEVTGTMLYYRDDKNFPQKNMIPKFNTAAKVWLIAFFQKFCLKDEKGEWRGIYHLIVHFNRRFKALHHDTNVLG